ncbi:hypothetical protein [Streptomyces sp. NPDC091259]|uniref:hypothetical protein n=1 Tax=Streptomyces sp. NPDC091259 TaxID=3365976 RepID=UPI003815265A
MNSSLVARPIWTTGSVKRRNHHLWRSMGSASAHLSTARARGRARQSATARSSQ